MSIIQSGRILKETEKLTIRFPKPFTEIPDVVITPYWENQNTAVNGTLTIDSVSLDSFKVVGSPNASNFFVSWIAVLNQK